MDNYFVDYNKFSGVCPKLMIWVIGKKHTTKRTTSNGSTIRSTFTFTWENSGMDFQFKIIKRDDNEKTSVWKWQDPIVGEVIFVQHNKTMPSEKIFHQWYDEGYPLQWDIPVSKLKWQEDGYWHTIELAQGKMIRRRDSHKCQQHTYWLHTRSGSGETEVIDWKEEITYSTGDRIYQREIKTPSLVKRFNYWNLGLLSWSIQQGETKHIYHVDERSITYLYIKQVQGRQVLYFEAMDGDNPKIRKDGRVQLSEKNRRNKRWMQFPSIPEEANISLHLV